MLSEEGVYAEREMSMQGMHEEEVVLVGAVIEVDEVDIGGE
jgi:hypothetical protein